MWRIHVTPTRKRSPVWNRERNLALGKVIRARREELGYQTRIVERRAHLTADIYARFEAGSRVPDVFQMQDLATALDTTVEELLSSIERRPSVRDAFVDRSRQLEAVHAVVRVLADSHRGFVRRVEEATEEEWDAFSRFTSERSRNIFPEQIEEVITNLRRIQSRVPRGT